MEILIAILIYLGLLNSNAPYTTEQVQQLEIQNRVQIEEVRRNGGFMDPTLTRDKTVWDHEEL